MTLQPSPLQYHTLIQDRGGAYVYLLSDSASYTTGIDIPIAGIVGAW